jgi:hypothetical protein
MDCFHQEVEKIMKRVLRYGVMAALLAVFVLASPASAQTVTRESTCTNVYGSNSMTYDCNFRVKDYVLGAPITVTVNYSCTGVCGGISNFGLKGKGYAPDDTWGRLIGGKLLANGLELTFTFDSVKKNADSGTAGNAFFTMSVGMDDGSGKTKPMSCPFSIHLVQ